MSNNILKKKILFQKIHIFYKFFYLYNNNYINFLFNNFSLNSLNNNFKVFLWYEREIKESFHIEFKNMFDTRNLLLDYNLTAPVLKKNCPLELFYELKTRLNILKKYKSHTVEL